MLDAETAKIVMEAINEEAAKKHYGEVITLEEARRMEDIKIAERGGYAILAFQRGDLTMLVKVSEIASGKRTAKVNFVCW